MAARPSAASPPEEQGTQRRTRCGRLRLEALTRWASLATVTRLHSRLAPLTLPGIRDPPWRRCPVSLVTQLVGFGLRQVIGDHADNSLQVVGLVERWFTDHSGKLPQALERAHERAWQALAVALAGDGLLDRLKVFFASGDDKGVREQVRLFL